MDRLVYVAMSGAKETLRAQAANNHNLANANTTGFRADLSAFQSRAVTGPGFASRAYATNSTTGWDRHAGAHDHDRPQSRRRRQGRRLASPCRIATATRRIRAPAICTSIRTAS